MNRLDRCGQRQQGWASRGLVITVGTSVLLVLALLACRPAAERTDAASGPVAAVKTSPQSAKLPLPMSSRVHASPRQLAVPYAYGNHAQEMFALEPKVGNVGQKELYPAPVRMSRKAAERAASTGFMDVTLPDGTRYPVTFERAEPGPRGNWTWVGRVDSPLGQLAAVLTYGRDGVFGVLPTPDGRMLQVQTSHGQAYLQPDPGLVPPGVDPEKPFPDYVVPPSGTSMLAAAAAPSSAGVLRGSGQNGVLRASARTHADPPAAAAPGWTGMVAPSAGSPSEVTVLGVYTTNLVEERGSAAAAETEFINLLEITNQAHLDSGTNARFELVGLLETDYPAELYNNVALGDLQGNQLKDGLDIHAERDAHGADLVAMLRPYAPGDSSCGIAYMNGGGLNGMNTSPSFGYGVTACGAFTMAHELGHNLGSHHDRETATNGGVLEYGAYEFSFGHRQTSPVSFATVMAYTLNGQPWLGYFSAPGNTSCMGSACGVADVSDNVRSINLMAETISRFRDPPGTISILDAQRLEPGAGYRNLSFPIRLASPAPVGGVAFDVQTIDGGTATPYVDYIPRPVTRQVIPEGERDAWFHVELLPDDVVEADETLSVRMSNVQGMTPYDLDAAGVIVDDDPRVQVTGSVVFPEGTQGPEAFTIYADSSFGGYSEWLPYTVSAPDYNYRLDVNDGADVRLIVYFPEDTHWIDVSQDLGVVTDYMEHDIQVERGHRITGRLRWPDGSPAPDGPISVVAWNLVGDGSGWSQFLDPPEFRYTFKARRGTAVGLETLYVAAPYVDQRVETFVVGDFEQDIVLSSLPSLTVAHQQISEGPAATSQTINFELRLSAPAPAGGVSFDLVLEGGSASGDSDYLAESWSMVIPEGNHQAWASLVVFGDNTHELDESFNITARNLTGAHMPTPGVIRIVNDDLRPVVSDFNRDGKSDLVWRHGDTGRAVLWHSAQYGQARNLVTIRDLNWQITGVGDFNADGRADLFWRHRGNGRNTIWRSGDYAAQLPVAGVSNTDWKVAGVGDFDGDGQSDVLWRNGRTGANTAWRGGNSRAVMRITNVTDTSWTVVGVGDFDGDARSDILWRNARTGAASIWLGGSYASRKRVVGIADMDWKIVGTGDVNADGEDDVLWRHQRSGRNVVWFSGEYGRRVSLTSVTNLDWMVATVGDYDGDAHADISWRNRQSGANVVWRAGDYRRQVRLTTISDTAWDILH